MVHSYTSNGTITLDQSTKFYINGNILFHHSIYPFSTRASPFNTAGITTSFQWYHSFRPLVSFFHTKVSIILTHWYYPFRPLHPFLSTNGTPPKSIASILAPMISFFPNLLCILNFTTQVSKFLIDASIFHTTYDST